MADEENGGVRRRYEQDRETIAETENVIETYQITAEWIRFADAKAAVVLTVNGALASVLIPTLKPLLTGWSKAGDTTTPTYAVFTIGAFVVWMGLTIASAWMAFRCIRPYRRKDNRHPAIDACRHFHAAAISVHYPAKDIKKFQEGFQKLGVDGFQQEVLAGLLIDAHISSRKYSFVGAAITLLGWGALPGFAYLLLAQL